MGAFRLDRLLELLTSAQVVVGVLWVGLAALSITLLVLIETRWGQSKPLRKCLLLSLLAHILLAGYATTVQIVAAAPRWQEPSMRVSLAQDASDAPLESPATPAERKPWETFVHESEVQPEPLEIARVEPEQMPSPERQIRAEEAGLRGDPLLERVPLVDSEEPEPQSLPAEPPPERPTVGRSAEPIEAPAAQRREAVRTEVPVDPQLQRPAHADAAYAPPVRNQHSGLPSALVQRPLPVPRLKDATVTPDPEDSLVGVTESTEAAGEGRPADWVAPQPPQTGTVPDTGSREGIGPAEDRVADVRPPALALRGGTAGGGGDDLDPVAAGRPGVGPPLMPVRRSEGGDQPVPEVYRDRVAPDREEVAKARGATPQSEEAVRLALKWMAENQEPGGNWSAGRHGAGRERTVDGRDRQAAGIRADTGVTGLSLLAFLAAGHTHQRGEHRETVRRGLSYLIRSQADDGNLSGQASSFAAMYCHAMATFALSEAYGMSGDERLREPVRRAVNYTLDCQNPTTGGWRYTPRDPGDTSQLGWQLMALKSAELAGIDVPVRARNGAIRYLNSVAYGQYGGLSSYRPGERVSRPMTAEALACRQFLGMSHGHPAGREAGDFLAQELPGDGRVNLYYWYYGTLAMYQLQGSHWEQWNAALQETLVSSQNKRGAMAGSWDADTVWGGYGGRVYSTALATLSLEVYYRFLPLYVEAAAAERTTR